jgi:anti-sigma regulatory factor (Ser/Thr protein kinase)
METLNVASELSEINKIRAFLKKNLAQIYVSEKDYYIIELSLLEICINIIRYAYPNDKGEIRLKAWNEKDSVFLEISDDGIPFDPRESKEPDLESMLSSGKKGGFGIFLAKKLMDGFEYKRENDKNILTIHKALEN